MQILALDLGTEMGYAIGDDKGGLQETGSVSFPFSKEKPILKKQKYSDYFDWLQKTIEKYDIKLIVYEKVMRHTGVLASHLYGFFEGVLLLLAGQKKILGVKPFGVTEIKSKVCSFGKASKAQVQQKVNQKYAVNLKNFNESDALAVYDTFVTFSQENLGKIHKGLLFLNYK